MTSLKIVSDRAYPFWPPSFPRPADSALLATSFSLLADLPLNQIPGGRADEIPLIQRPLPRQAYATGPGSTTNEERGSYGTDLYDLFMSPYNPAGQGGKT